MKKSIWNVLVWGLPALIIGWIFRLIILCPNCYLFRTSGDALKNYFTFAYFVKFDNGLHFSGMNYPYGEHILFTDNQPIIALLANFIDNSLLEIGDYSVGVLNILMVLSIYFCYLFCFLILRMLKLPPWAAGVLGLLITLLSPQITRFSGHFSLAYCFYIPAVIYLILRAYNNPKDLKWPALLLLAGFVATFTHLYYFLMIVIFLLGYAFLQLLVSKRQFRHSISILVATGILAGITLAVLRFTDSVDDRPENPWGVYHHHATTAGMYLPSYQPAEKTAMHLLGVSRPDGEGRSYVGLIPLLLLPFLGWKLVKKSGTPKQNVAFMCIFGAGILEWVFATGILYKIGLDTIWDLLPALKQFRSLGRLSWPLYYVWTIGAAWVLYHGFEVLKLRRKTLVAYPLFTLAILFWGYECFLYIQSRTTGLYNNNTVLTQANQRYPDFLKDHGLEVQDFQCQIQLPYVAVGAEKYVIDNGVWAIRNGMQSAFQTGLPLINIYMSRTSVRQSLNSIQLFSHPEIPKERVEDLDKRPILILSEDRLLNSFEASFVSKAEKIGFMDPVTISVLPVDSLAKRAHMDAKTSASDFRYIDFNSFTEKGFIGTAAKRVHSPVPDTLCYFEAKNFDSVKHELSLWVLVDEKSPVFPILEHERILPSGERSKKGFSMFDLELFDVIGNWVRISYSFVPGNEKHGFYLAREGIVYDALLIRPDGEDVVIKNDEGEIISMNNYLRGAELLKHYVQN